MQFLLFFFYFSVFEFFNVKLLIELFFQKKFVLLKHFSFQKCRFLHDNFLQKR